jgi:DNA-binding PadR family transcriptional regulator
MVVLSLLAEAPMHAYRMQQLIKERHKDEVVNVAQRNSVYQTIDRLLRDGLVRVTHTAREERRPERTVYELSPAGLSTLHTWLREMLGTPAREFPDYPAALAFLPILPVDDVLARLRERIAVLVDRLAAAETTRAEAGGWLAPVFLVEDDYRIAMTRAELEWTRALITRIESGEVTWNREGLPPPPSPSL